MNKGNAFLWAGTFGFICFLVISAMDGSNEVVSLFSEAQADVETYENRPIQYVLREKEPPTVWQPPIHLISAPYYRNGQVCRLGSSGAEYCYEN